MAQERLVWIGPRERDIVYCEEGLFCGSITLFGSNESPTDAPHDGESAHGKPNERRLFNHCLSSDGAFGRFGGEQWRINQTSHPLIPDIFTLYWQLKLIDSEEGCTYYFMRSDPNKLPRDPKEDVYLLLAYLCGYSVSEETADGRPCGDFDRALTAFVDSHKKPSDDPLALVLSDKSGYISTLKPRFSEFTADRPVGRLLKEGPGGIEKIHRLLRERTLCVNTDYEFLDMLQNRHRFRKYFCGLLNIPSLEDVMFPAFGTGEDAVRELKNHMHVDAVVIQKQDSHSGSQSMVVGPKLDSDARSVANFIGTEPFIASRYRYPNIPLNVHAVIGSDDILVAPISVQVVDRSENRLKHLGTDFPAAVRFLQSNPKYQSEINNYVTWLAKAAQSRGYRGIINFDLMVSDKLEFIGCNGRFHGSTMLLNRSLAEYKYVRDSEGHVMVDLTGRKIVLSRRLPSMQFLNLCAFAASDRTGGVVSRLVSKVSENSEGRFPITRGELSHLRIPYAMMTYFHDVSDSDTDLIDGIMRVRKNTASSEDEKKEKVPMFTHGELVYRRVNEELPRGPDWDTEYEPALKRTLSHLRSYAVSALRREDLDPEAVLLLEGAVELSGKTFDR